MTSDRTSSLRWGSPLRMSQSQLLQPFVGILAAVRLLGELLDAITPGFALLVVASVFMKRRTTKHTRPQ